MIEVLNLIDGGWAVQVKTEMNSATPIKHVDSSSLPVFEDTLWEWINVIDRCTRTWAWEDVPWWYNERANISILAGAIWRTGGIAFEEFSSEKLSPDPSRPDSPKQYAGRCDLYIDIARQEFYGEAKQVWSAAGKRAPDPASQIQKAIDMACLDARKNNTYGGQPLALVFAVPYLSISYQNAMDDLINRWVERVSRIECSAKAWNFPMEVRLTAKNEHSFFPGVALLIKRI